MLDPTSGIILIDGVDVRSATLKSLRKRISVVPQDTCLFDDTILYNIMYGNPSASENDLFDAIEKSNLHSTIDKLQTQEKGLLTVVGERGARLSGGERQKVSIARFLFVS
jgi:ATP-binding cassette subfamily B protein